MNLYAHFRAAMYASKILVLISRLKHRTSTLTQDKADGKANCYCFD